MRHADCRLRLALASSARLHNPALATDSSGEG